MNARSMSLPPTAPGTPPSGRESRSRLIDAATSRLRQAPAARALLRRRITIRLTKWLLPAAALALLTIIAIWPEFDRATERARISFRRIAAEIEGAKHHRLIARSIQNFFVEGGLVGQSRWCISGTT